ncbi:serine/threonine-protein kinase [Cohnella cellulosilytica]|uniref:non-specific serine/threonine protein kinase n=1 Tax=Cohnella cellulosilytica TaxID=986710 RepID=A0ABW2F4X6_9BACL
MDNPHRDELILTPGQLFGERYRIAMAIGKGGMGRVYLAEDTRLGGKPRALKLTRPLPEERRSFLPEAQLLSELDHPHLPAIVDYYPPDADGVACIVMDYIAGDTLADRFERYGLRLGFPFVLDVLIDLTNVLTYLHAQTPAVVFRDLKPANVLLGHGDKAVLVDFGIARRYREHKTSDTLQLGTPGFAAPEQLRGEQSDERTDLYGLGALAYFLLSGGRFAMRHRGTIAQALQEDVPVDFAHLLGRMLAAEPADRPRSADELLEELHRIKLDLVGTDGLPPPSREAERHRSDTRVVAMLSAYPGAGATFAALALSAALNRQGKAHALVECPGGEAELYALLNGERRMPRNAVFARADGRQAAAPAWREGAAAYYPLHPGEETAVNRTPGKELAKWIRRLGAPLALLDVSSRWDHPEVADFVLRAADVLVLTADCYPAKWSARRQAACAELHAQAERRSIRCVWIANRDQPFRDRGGWLSLFPESPEACLPELPSDVMLNALWRGRGFPGDERTARAMERAFRRLPIAAERRSPGQSRPAADFSSL